MRSAAGLAAALLMSTWCCAVSITAQNKGRDGALLSAEPVHLTLSYEAWLGRAYDSLHADPRDANPDFDRIRNYYTERRYVALDGAQDVRVDHIVFSSDGLRIHGFRIEPKQPGGMMVYEGLHVRFPARAAAVKQCAERSG